MKLRSYLVVDRRNGEVFQVWAKSQDDAQLEYMSVHGNYWKDSDFRIVRLKGEMEVADTPRGGVNSQEESER